MKKSKLKLKKEVIANLTQKEQSSIKGGGSFFRMCDRVRTGAGCYPGPDTVQCGGGSGGPWDSCEQCNP